MTALVEWTGHALIDVGIAGLCAFAKKRSPEELTLGDLDAASEFMEAHYYGGSLTPYLSCVFMNSSFVQPSEGKDKREAFIRYYLRAHRTESHPRVEGMTCAFCGRPAISPLVRTHLPLFSGEGVVNFRPGGTTFVPASGECVVALMFLPLASRRSEGGLLAVHADEPDLTLRFAARYLDDNRRLLAMALPTERAPVHPGYDRELPSWDTNKKHYKFADAKGPRSLVVSDLAEIAAHAMPTDRRPHPVSLTAYLISNSGQGPSFESFGVPSGAVSFIVQAAGASTTRAWRAVAERFRPVTEGEETEGKRTRKRTAAPVAGRAGWSRNPAFEDLCGIYDAGFMDRAVASRWLRTWVLGRLDRKGGTSYRDERARSWKLAELFLTEVLGMKKGRIDQIRAFADKLAEWIHSRHDRKLFNALMYGRLSELQHALRRVQRESAGGAGLLFGLDEYAGVWLHEEGDQYLARDLMCIRVVEQLHAAGYFAAHPEETVTTEDATEETEPQEERA